MTAKVNPVSDIGRVKSMTVTVDATSAVEVGRCSLTLSKSVYP